MRFYSFRMNIRRAQSITIKQPAMTLWNSSFSFVEVQHVETSLAAVPNVPMEEVPTIISEKTANPGQWCSANDPQHSHFCEYLGKVKSLWLWVDVFIVLERLFCCIISAMLLKSESVHKRKIRRKLFLWGGSRNKERNGGRGGKKERKRTQKNKGGLDTFFCNKHKAWHIRE